jgi:ABC-type nitrate/sulfonate/bicarbonate transport system permease component
VVSAAAAIGLATVATLVKLTKPAIYNLAVLTYSVPLLALSPILVVWFGNGPTARVVIAAVSGFFPILVGAMQGLAAVDSRQAELFHALAASPWQRFRLLALPSALGFIFSGLKISAASVVLGAIVAEWAGAERGLGVMMAYALYAFNVEQVWLTTVVTVACAAGCYGLVLGAERLIMPWHRPAMLPGSA